MRRSHRRRLTCELWRVNERIRQGEDLMVRRAWLIEKLGGERPWGPRSQPWMPRPVSASIAPSEDVVLEGQA